MKTTFRLISFLATVAVVGVGLAHTQQPQERVVITSVEPLSGYEGTIVTLKGRNFPTDSANSCIVIGGMGAMACVEPNPTSTELRVKIGPVAKETSGDLLMWPGTAAFLQTKTMSYGRARLVFSKTKLFRNGAPVTSAGIDFRLTKTSPNTYAGYFEESPGSRVELGGLERGPVIRVSFPNDLECPKGTTVDVDFLLKEPTLAIEYSAEITGDSDAEECLRSIAKGIVENARFIGEKVYADVTRNRKTGELELYVTKPYLESGKGSVRFNMPKTRKKPSPRRRP